MLPLAALNVIRSRIHILDETFRPDPRATTTVVNAWLEGNHLTLGTNSIHGKTANNAETDETPAPLRHMSGSHSSKKEALLPQDAV